MTAVCSSVHQEQQLNPGKSVTIWEVTGAGFTVVFGIIMAVIICYKIYSVCKRSLKRLTATKRKHDSVAKSDLRSCSLGSLIRLPKMQRPSDDKEDVASLHEGTKPATALTLQPKRDMENKAFMFEKCVSKQSASVKKPNKDKEREHGKEKSENENKTPAKERILCELSESLAGINPSRRKLLSDISKELKMKHQFQNEKLRLGYDRRVLKSEVG